MQKVEAFYNHGRWVAGCPKCAKEGRLVASEINPGDIFVCPEEYPNLLAVTFIPNPRVKGAFNPVPDKALRKETFEAAVKEGDGYEVIFPREWKEIEALLSARPKAARNWFPSVTIADIEAENAEHEMPVEEEKL